MKYKDGAVTDEGDYCECRDGFCSKEWDDNAGASLSWQHYERAHWSVQYKLCRPLFQGKPDCQGSELGAQVETAVAEWAPDVTLPRCVCPNNALYRITGWKRTGKGAIWEYYYTCEKKECLSPSSNQPGEKVECARIYVDTGKKTDKVLEMQFKCSCPESYLCPAKYNEKEDDSRLESDEDKRSYVPKECEAIVKRKRSS
ncbi:hypothetical protein RRG08_039100 [Elysia crispata]|uniref:Uncharacterized protein n=1 Tax=Elysia crispata TaxID=231223 RepID=A0AAE0ZMQ2_9GAST|nr:hypothetical protein RRG08_039100 [Elysia crispata]